MEKPKFPYNTSSIVADLLMTWSFPMIAKYQKLEVNPSTLMDIPANLSLDSLYEKFSRKWKDELLKNPKPNLLRVLYKIFGWEYFFCILPMVFSYIFLLCQSVLVMFSIRYMNSDDVDDYQGALLILGFAGLMIIGSLCNNLSGLRIVLLIGRLKNTLSRAVANKILDIKLTEFQGNNKGKVINLISTDMELLELFITSTWMWVLPIYLAGAFIVLGVVMGPAGVIGLIVSTLHVPLILWLSKYVLRIKISLTQISDMRIKTISNLIEGIRIVKLYGWEEPFIKYLCEYKKQEFKKFMSSGFINGCLKVLIFSGTGITIFTMLALYNAFGHTIKTEIVYLVFSILFQTQYSVDTVITGARTTLLLLTAIKRCNQCLLIPEKSHIPIEESQKRPVRVNHAYFSWQDIAPANSKTDSNLLEDNANEICLNDVNFKLKSGELLVVVGPVGAGKSSLLMGLLGEINIVQGDYQLNHTVAYASDEPWLVAGSIKENILMGLEYDENVYNETVAACALAKDFQLFEAGDETLVGDRGITLSGGQKARISLARAVYSQKEILFLDDPLSAVDAEVSGILFNECIKKALKGKTVILVTHQVNILSQADKILVLDAGSQIFFGKYEKFLQSPAALAVIGEIGFEKHKTHTGQETEKKVGETEKVFAKQKIDEEEIVKTVKASTIYWRYFKYGFKWTIVLIFIILVLLFSQASYLSIVYWPSYWSRQSSDEQDESYYLWMFGILVGVLYIAGIFRIFSVIMLCNYANRDLHNAAVRGITETPTVFFDKNPTGRIINRFTKDVGIIDEPMTHMILLGSDRSLFILGSVVMMCVVNPYLIAFFPIWIIVAICVFKYTLSITKGFRSLELVSRSPIITCINAMINGLSTIRSMDMQENFKKLINGLIVENYKSYIGYHMFLRFSQLYVDLGCVLLTIANVSLIIGTKGSLNPSLAGVSLSLTCGLLGNSSVWTKTMVEISNLMASAQRLLEYADLKPEGAYETANKFAITKGKIQFDNVFMKYRENFDYALKGLSFTIEPGLKVGVVGRTGAGKSSILQVLFRLVNPAQGTIYIDDQDYLVAGLHQLRKQMSVIPQQAIIFNATFRDNLDPFHEHSTDEILAALNEVNLSGIVSSLSNGLETYIRGEGINLSSGQKQLVCLARAILRKNKVVMMDEATANVDNETDNMINSIVKTKFEGCTLLIIAHRLRTIIDSDKILVVSEGICKEEGKPADLAAQEDSFFRKMIDHTGVEESKYLLNKLSIF
ncbi:unnamed protein product [Blepharisma stoltei]|uniref:Uncharacterized protein n=1 Tax=Blepharisma stoltei TaxID=1481888 RepID=A0AAU9INU9_9CILI|nr:unnamed protein product [Blepharisma stoltei]